jgi:streptogramin lyase
MRWVIIYLWYIPLIVTGNVASILIFYLFYCIFSAWNAPSDNTLPPPKELRAEVNRNTARLTWQPVQGAVGYRLYCAKDDPYRFEPLHDSSLTEPRYTLQLEDDSFLHFAVTAVDFRGRESVRSRSVGVMRLSLPWGVAVMPGGRRLIRDARRGRTILQHADGSVIGLIGPTHICYLGSYDLTIDRKGYVFSAKWGDPTDPRQGFIVQDAAMNVVVSHLAPPGSAPGHFQRPMGIGVNSEGHIFVADTGNDRVQEFNPEGEFVRVIGAGELRQPMKVAFDKRDRLYVADSGKNRIAIFEAQPNGEYKLLKSLSGPIKEPVYVVVDERGRVFVSTNRVAGVYMFDAKGRPAWKYEVPKGDSLNGPRGLAFDGKGNLLVVDEATQRVLTLKMP